MAKILIVDDEIGIRELLSEILRDEGYDVVLAENAPAAKALRTESQPDLILLDIWMPEIDGLTLLKDWAAHGQLNVPVVMMSGHATIDTAVEATRIGAMDFLEKPIGMQKLLQTVKKSLERGSRKLHSTLSLAAFTRPSLLRDLKRRFDQLLSNNPMLLLRSPPSGIVELVALTAQLPDKPVINLAHTLEPLDLDKLASLTDGLLWCEELTRLNRLQQKNLLFAAERLAKYRLRLVVGTTHDITSLIAHGWEEQEVNLLFQSALGLPSLRDLKDEIPDIATHLLNFLTAEEGVPPRRFSAGALNALRHFPWVSGYTGLRSAVKSLAVASLDEEISTDEVRQILNPAGEGVGLAEQLAPELIQQPLREAREAFERIYFEHHLQQVEGNMVRLAEKTGLERTHLYRKLKDLGLR
jgi:DNA-binding NtrC family response regulator